MHGENETARLNRPKVREANGHERKKNTTKRLSRHTENKRQDSLMY